MTNQPTMIRCDSCGRRDARARRCVGCFAAWYCGVSCQRAHWKRHKAMCRPWSAKVRMNGWVGQVSVDSPSVVQAPDGTDLFRRIKSGSLEDISSAPLNTARGMHGEVALHIAVTTGNPEIVRRVIDAGAFVGAYDYRMNSPLYYACTHPNITSEENRCAIVLSLLDAGADPWDQGGISGKRSFEVAEKALASTIKSHSKFALIKRIRDSVNSDVPKDLKKLVPLWCDLRWRSMTATWLTNPGRHNMQQCLRPHPSLVGADDLEEILRDCAGRYTQFALD